MDNLLYDDAYLYGDEEPGPDSLVPKNVPPPKPSAASDPPSQKQGSSPVDISASSDLLGHTSSNLSLAVEVVETSEDTHMQSGCSNENLASTGTSTLSSNTTTNSNNNNNDCADDANNVDSEEDFSHSKKRSPSLSPTENSVNSGLSPRAHGNRSHSHTPSDHDTNRENNGECGSQLPFNVSIAEINFQPLPVVKHDNHGLENSTAEKADAPRISLGPDVNVVPEQRNLPQISQIPINDHQQEKNLPAHIATHVGSHTSDVVMENTAAEFVYHDPAATPALLIEELSWWTADDDIIQIALIATNDPECILDMAFFEHRANGKSRGSVWVLFSSVEAAAKTKLQFESIEIDNRIPIVSFCDPNISMFRVVSKDSQHHSTGIAQQQAHNLQHSIHNYAHMQNRSGLQQSSAPQHIHPQSLPGSMQHRQHPGAGAMHSIGGSMAPRASGLPGVGPYNQSYSLGPHHPHMNRHPGMHNQHYSNHSLPGLPPSHLPAQPQASSGAHHHYGQSYGYHPYAGHQNQQGYPNQSAAASMHIHRQSHGQGHLHSHMSGQPLTQANLGPSSHSQLQHQQQQQSAQSQTQTSQHQSSPPHLSQMQNSQFPHLGSNMYQNQGNQLQIQSSKIISAQGPRQPMRRFPPPQHGLMHGSQHPPNMGGVPSLGPHKGSLGSAAGVLPLQNMAANNGNSQNTRLRYNQP